ncbi:hypothetical protein [Gimesia maris]|nr:hypothetical protein [Gimesia maris]EDL56916.1 hypothetical protein PM8797T_07357 [Gimesia maris DSM 8797]
MSRARGPVFLHLQKLNQCRSQHYQSLSFPYDFSKYLLKHVVRIDTHRPGIVLRHPDVASLSTHINLYRHPILFISP